MAWARRIEKERTRPVRFRVGRDELWPLRKADACVAMNRTRGGKTQDRKGSPGSVNVGGTGPPRLMSRVRERWDTPEIQVGDRKTEVAKQLTFDAEAALLEFTVKSLELRRRPS